MTSGTTGDISDAFHTDGMYYRVSTRVPPEKGIDNVFDAIRAGYPICVEAHPGTNVRRLYRLIRRQAGCDPTPGGIHFTTA